MKLNKRLFVGNDQIDLVTENIQLDLFSPGRAEFTIKVLDNNKPDLVAKPIRFLTGYDIDNLKPWFSGVIESCIQVDKYQYKLFCREFSSLLFYESPIALRSASISQILNVISNNIGLGFSLPTNNPIYLRSVTPVFYNIGCGYNALDNIGDIFSIPRYLWQQQGDGSIYVGSWNDHSYSKPTLNIAREYEKNVLVSNGATIPALPNLRPGVMYNGAIITQIIFCKIHMQVFWSLNPWKDKK